METCSCVRCERSRWGIATFKAIRRNHPFFKSGGMFGHDWRTFGLLYPRACSILKAAQAAQEGR